MFMAYSVRHLPHLTEIGHPLFVTFRLHGSLPQGREFRQTSMTSGKAFVCMDRLLASERSGPTYLKMPAIAKLVADAIEAGSKDRYLLHAWVVMPNHVHLLITPQIEVRELMRRLKGSTAREANLLLGLTGQPFWQEESYDHLVRNAYELGKIENYILQNPVQAGLARNEEEYPWSSASRRLTDSGLKPVAG